MIRIDDKYVIFPQVYGYVLAVDAHIVNKRGRNVYTSQRYYSTLEGALSAVYELKTRMALAEGTHDLKDALRIVKEMNYEMREKLKEALQSEGGDDR